LEKSLLTYHVGREIDGRLSHSLEFRCCEDWEIIATNLTRELWSWSCIVSMDSERRDIFVVQAHRDGKRFIVRADES
jgi:hypothetical protein